MMAKDLIYQLLQEHKELTPYQVAVILHIDPKTAMREMRDLWLEYDEISREFRGKAVVYIYEEKYIIGGENGQGIYSNRELSDEGEEGRWSNFGRTSIAQERNE